MQSKEINIKRQIRITWKKHFYNVTLNNLNKINDFFIQRQIREPKSIKPQPVDIFHKLYRFQNWENIQINKSC